jgi:hypothetical protein
LVRVGRGQEKRERKGEERSVWREGEEEESGDGCGSFWKVHEGARAISVRAELSHVST